MPRVCITVSGKNAQPYRFSLERKIVRLGRAADNDIIIDDPSVSSHHCEMRRVDGGYILEDLGSTNGIKLDDDRMEIIDLENDQEIRVGDALLEFQLQPEELDTLAGEDHTPHQRAHLPPVTKPKAETDPGHDDLDQPAPETGPAPKHTDTAGHDLTPPAKTPSPPRQQPEPRTPETTTPARRGFADFLATLAFLILATFAFYLGLASKHRSAGRGSLWDSIFHQDSRTEQPAARPTDEPPAEPPR